MSGQLWFFLALGASICWGLAYTIDGRLIGQGLPGSFLLLLSGCAMLPFLALFSWQTGGFQKGLDFMAEDKARWALLVVSMTSVLAGRFLMFESIRHKNVSLASLIEISYPVFIILFTWFLFREFHLNAASALGGVMVLGGVALIYLKG